MVISVLKSAFSQHGIPEVVHNDNGPQFPSEEFARFTSSYELKHLEQPKISSEQQTS